FPGAEYKPGYDGPLIAMMGNFFAITANGRPVRKIDDLALPTEAKLFVDMGARLHTVWTGRTESGQPTYYGSVWPLPVHYARSSKRGKSGKAGINAVMADGHVTFWGGQRYDAGPGKVEPQLLWWRHGVEASVTWP